MTRLEYIRQLPGCKYKNAFDMPCPRAYGIDDDFKSCYKNCGQCWQGEATIDGNPAPHLFVCPLKPGQKVYGVRRIRGKYVVLEYEIWWVRFGKSSWFAEIGTTSSFFAKEWLDSFFPTREAAEKRLKEMRNETD